MDVKLKRSNLISLSVSLVIALIVSMLSITATAQSFVPAGDGKLLLIGQSNKASWDDFVQIGEDPSGGSVYYNVRYSTFNTGKNGEPIHRDYADFLASHHKIIQVGVSWKDDPPGYNGGANKEQVSKQVTEDIPTGAYDANFQPLIDYMNAHSNATFFLRLDYEVSDNFHCTETESCQSYKDAFNYLAQMINSKLNQDNVSYVYHPVRGAVELMYPGDTYVDWIGLSIFNHEVCLPIYDPYYPNGPYLYNGEPGAGYNVTTQKCMGYEIVEDEYGNDAPAGREFDYDQNVLIGLKFAKDHNKPVIFSESAPMNFSEGQNPDGTEPDAMVAKWVDRVFGLMNYNGPIPNMKGTYDLSGAVRAIVYMNLDLRYGWDGDYGQGEMAFNYDADWYNNARLSKYNLAQAAFCNGLSVHQFTTTCGSTDPGGQEPVDITPPSNVTGVNVTGTTTNTLELSWNIATDNEGVAGYEVYDNASNQLVASTVGASSTSVTIGNLQATTSYSYYVKAVDFAGNKSVSKSNIATGTTQDDTTSNPEGYLTGVQENGDGIAAFWIDCECSQVYVHWNTGTSESSVDVPIQQINQNNYGITSKTDGRFERTASVADGAWVSFFFNYIVDGIQYDTTSKVFQMGSGTVQDPNDPDDPNDNPGNPNDPNAGIVPGIVTLNAGSIVNGSSENWNVNVSQSGTRTVKVTSTSSQNSQLIDVTFNGVTVTQAIDAGSTLNVYFNNVPAGSNILTITAKSGSVSIGEVEIT